LHSFRPIEGHGDLAGVGDAVQRVSGGVHHGAWADVSDPAVAFNFEGAFADDEKFLFGMAMRRVGLAPGSRMQAPAETPLSCSVGPL